MLKQRFIPKNTYLCKNKSDEDVFIYNGSVGIVQHCCLLSRHI